MNKTIPITAMTRLPTEHDEFIEEALSEIYECFENGVLTEPEIRVLLDTKIRKGIIDELASNRLVEMAGGKVQFLPAGESIAHHVIRRKRLAERLLKDVLNVKDEFIDPAACQWEHILSKEVTNSICTLLGHPVQSPLNMKIPAGECCKMAATAVEPVVCSLEKLGDGDKAKIAYLLLKQNPELHRLLSLGLVPGTVVEVIQRFPTFVVQVNESQLAFDELIAQAIFVVPF